MFTKIPNFNKFIGLSICIIVVSLAIFLFAKRENSLADTSKPVSIGELSASDNNLVNQAIDDLVKIRQDAQEDMKKREQEWLSKIGKKELDFATLKGAIIKGANKEVATTDIIEKPDSKGQLATDPKLRVYQFIEKPKTEAK